MSETSVFDFLATDEPLYTPVEASPSTGGAFVPSNTTTAEGESGRELWCELGSHQWLYTGTATTRIPKSCPDHKVRSGNPVTTRSTGGKKLEDLKTRLGVFVGSIGKGSSSMLPVMGTVLMVNSVKAANATVELCKDNAKALEILDKITLAVPALDLGEVLAAAFVAAAVDMGRLDPAAMPAQLLGVSEIYEKVHGVDLSRPRNDDGSPMGSNVSHLPPRFQAIH